MHQFYTPYISSEIYTLNEEESKHCIRVLRLKLGDRIQLLDGKGNLFIAEIMDEHSKKCIVKIVETKQTTRSKNWTLHIALAPTKSSDRLEWFTEKATEIGIDQIIPINCANSERTVLKTERLIKVAVSAIKQSLNPFLPKIEELTDFKKFIEQTKNFKGQKFIAHCFKNEEKSHIKNSYKKGNAALILIGPEGDFTTDEVKYALANGFEQISLGKNRLRTETAALYACTNINMLNET